jgi:membrane fusion protein, heavy metal efflux system
MTFFLHPLWRTLAVGAGIGLLMIWLPPARPAAAHNGEDHGDAPASTTNGHTVPNEVQLPKESQFLFDIRTERVASTALLTRRTLLGTVTAAPGGDGRVVVPQTGRVVSLTVQAGQRVHAGQVIAVLDQTLAAPDHLGLATTRANAQAELRAAEQDYQRLQAIADIAARKDVVSAELRLRQARQNAALATGQSRRVNLTAPISGTVEMFALTVGQQVQAGDELLRVINPRRLTVTAQVFADDLAALNDGAQFGIEALPGAGPRTGRLAAHRVTISNVMNVRNQARQLVLSLSDSADAAPTAPTLRVGQQVQIRVQTRAAVAQLVVPTSAVTDVNGLPAVFLHTAPETFTLRFVRLGEGDDRQTAILGGLFAGERVVTTNTYQLKSVYLNQ